MSVSVLILTLNEELNLPSCLESVAWSDDIVVFDSFSTDDTERIARDMGARFIQRAFDDYSSQRNAALTEVEYKHPWVLMVDADECATPEVAEETNAATAQADDDVALFRFRRKDYFMGRWLKRSSGYPTWFARVMRPGRVIYEREINEDTLVDGRTEMLNCHLIHYPFNKGMAFWFERHNRYSSMEAKAHVGMSRHKLLLRGIFSSDPIVRRQALKGLAFRLPCRPLLTFLFLYVVRLGILDGFAGLTYCRMRALYERMIDQKTRALKRQAKGLPV